MTSALEGYGEYKDSGAEWLGDVPTHWEVRRIKDWLRMNQTVLPEDTDSDYEFRYVDIGAVQTGVLAAEPERMRFGASPSRARRVLRRGDTIVSTVRTYLKAVWHVPTGETDLVASTGFAVLTPQAATEPAFVGYLCRSQPFTDCVMAQSVGVAYPAIAETRLAVVPVAIPPLEEQTAIGRFLNYADQRTRRAVRQKEKLVALLEEQRQTLIDQAVTGQLDVRTGQPYPAYRKSGLDWLPEMPAHWSLRRNGRLFAERHETGFGDLPVLEVSLHTGVQVRDLRGGDRKQQMTDRDKYKRAAKGDLAYNMMRLWQGAIGVVPTDGLASPAYVVARPLDGVEAAYYDHLFRTDRYKRQVDRNSRGIVSDRNRLYWDAFKRMASPCPPPEEQKRIVKYLRAASDRLDAGVGAARRQVALLQEFRTRLIADVVTGKLDVRNAAAALPRGATSAWTREQSAFSSTRD